MAYTAKRTKGGASIRATGADAQKLFDMMISKTAPFDKLAVDNGVAAGVSTGPVSGADAVRFANELDAALMEVANGKRKAGAIPMEPMARLIQFARDNADVPARAAATIPG